MSDRAQVRHTRYLSEADVAALLPAVAEQIELVLEALSQVADRRAHQPPKIALPAGANGRFFHLMPAVVRAGSGQVAGAKWISGGGGLPIDGLVIVEDESGATRGLVAAAGLTAARTAAVSGAAIRAARRGLGAVSRVAFVGGGVQAHSHRAMLASEHPSASVTFLTRRNAGELPLRADDRVAQDAVDALRDAELLITAAAFGTEARALPLVLLAPDATIIAIDYATTIRGEDLTLMRAHRPVRLMTDSAEQFNATRAAGKLDGWPEIFEELGARGNPEFLGTTIVNHLGAAACDLLLADLLLTSAEERKVGRLLTP
jgi:ornithine cyclodeaminase/alanine dehydrogenase-like protein (mu-crystallin family)